MTMLRDCRFEVGMRVTVDRVVGKRKELHFAPEGFVI